jgi:1-hydroxycarotenoid 3,4-desaturase
VRHNVFFSSDYRAEFDALERGKMPTDPTVYVCAEDRQDGDVAPEGAERLFILVNAPARPSGFDVEEVSRCETHMRKRLAQAGLELGVLESQVTTPSDFARLFPGSLGALYGAATNSPWASLRRPGSRTTIPGLYLAGGSVHPGPGVPMAALSGLCCARLIDEDRPWTPRSPPAATPGGTSTSKATMGVMP